MSAAPLYCSLQERLLPEPLNANADNVRAASSNTLTVASDGKVLIKALDGCDTVEKNNILYPYNPTCLYKSAF